MLGYNQESRFNQASALKEENFFSDLQGYNLQVPDQLT
jgi:hypothetical protein